MGELLLVSLVGVGMMVVLCAYVLWLALVPPAYPDTITTVFDPAAIEAPIRSTAAYFLGVPTAASTFGYAFYIQPCALPLLRTLPKGDAGADILTEALYVTFAFTACAYLIVGVGGLLIFGQGHVPQDLLQGFSGRTGGYLSGFFCLYLCLGFPPIVVPLREVMVRFWRRQHPSGASTGTATATATAIGIGIGIGTAHSNADAGALKAQRAGKGGSADDSPEVVVVSYGRRDGPDARDARDAGGPERAGAALSGRADDLNGASTLPPLGNALLTSAIVGGALLVALMLPDASSTLFALTGATGVSAVSYVLPIYALCHLDEAKGGVAIRRPPAGSAATHWKARWRHEQRGIARTFGSGLRFLMRRVWPGAVLLLGLSVSALTLIAVAEKSTTADAASAAVCTAGDERRLLQAS